jgi:ubiquitin-protein ligase
MFPEDLSGTEEHIIIGMAFTLTFLREFKHKKDDGRLGETTQIVSTNIGNWHATLFSVKDTHWANAVLDLEFVFSAQYLNEAPNVHFAGTIAFHPIISVNGEICFDFLQHKHYSAKNTVAMLYGKSYLEYLHRVRGCVEPQWNRQQ